MTVAILGVSGPVAGPGGKLARNQSQVVNAFKDSLVRAMKEEAPINKDPAATSRGGLRTSIQGRVVGNQEDGYAIEFTANDYVQYVLNGTRPHIIRPVNKKALAFQWHTGTFRGPGHAGRGSGGGFLRSTPYTRLPLKYVQLGSSMNRAVGRKNMALNRPRFGGRELVQPQYNSRGRMTQRGVFGHVQPVNVKKNMEAGHDNTGNIVLKIVHHPGTQPNDFVERALLKVTPQIDDMADAMGDEIADRIVGIMTSGRQL